MCDKKRSEPLNIPNTTMIAIISGEDGPSPNRSSTPTLTPAIARGRAKLGENGALSKQNTVSFDQSDGVASRALTNNSSVRITVRNNSILRSRTPTSLRMGIPTTSSTLAPLLNADDNDRRQRRSSARSMFDAQRKCVFVRQTSTASSNCAPSLASSIMQALSTSINTAATTTTIVVGKPQYVSYPQRWFVLATTCLLALSNATQWLSFVSLHEAAANFYCTRSNSTNARTTASIVMPVVVDCGVEYWTSQIFQIVGVLTGIFGMYITDRFGIRVSIYCGSILNFAGAVIRVSSSLPNLLPEHRLPLLYFGQTVAAMSQPFFLCLSPKVAEYWFSENQRTFANALSFIANPFGVVVGSAVPFVFVSKNPTAALAREILWLNMAVLSLATLVVLMAVGIRTSRPPTPPSASSDCANVPLFFEGLFILFRKPIFYVQMITFGMAFAIQWSFFITADKMLTKLKYHDKLVGYLLPLSALSGSVASVLVGYVVDRSKKFKEVINLSYVGLSIVAVLLDIFLRRPRETSLDVWILVGLLMALGFFSIPVFPVSLELGVETTFPVAEATSSGILCIAGQLLLFILTFWMSIFENLDWLYSNVHSSENYQLSIDFWTVSAVVVTIFGYIFLRPRYRRLEYEENAIVFSNIPPSSTPLSSSS